MEKVNFPILKILHLNNNNISDIKVLEKVAFNKLEGLLLNNNPLKYTHNCKISVVIPVYNCEKTIKPLVRSIQNQDMADIEIILVNDNSKDNTSIIIQELVTQFLINVKEM